MIPPTIHLVDDDESFLRAAARLMRACGFPVKTFNSAGDFLSQLDDDARGCVISDLHMPGMNCLDLQDAMARGGYAMPIIFLTGNGDIPSTVSAIKQGAVDYLEKHAPKERLMDAVHLAMKRDESARGQRALLAELRSRFSTLSARETEVLEKVVQGRMNKEIAAELCIHERTVKLHRTAITTKLQVQSVAELTRLWLHAGRKLSDVKR